MVAYNNAEGGSDGLTVTTGNSGGDSGTALANVNIPSGSAAVFSDDQSAHGNLSYALTAASAQPASVRLHDVSTGMQWSARAYVRLTGLPTQAQQFLEIRHTGNAVVARLHLQTDGTLQAIDAAGAAISGGLSTTVLSLDTWYRITFRGTVNASTGTALYDIYAGDSTTSIEGKSLTGVNTGSTAAQRWGCGKLSTAGDLATVYLDDLAITTATSVEMPSAGGELADFRAVGPQPFEPGGAFFRDPMWVDWTPPVGGPVALDGSGSASADASAQLDSIRDLAGSGAAAAGVGGTLVADRPVTASAGAAASASGTLSITRDVAGVSPAASGLGGVLDGARTLVGAGPASASASGVLAAARPLAGSGGAAAGASGSAGTDRAYGGSSPAASGASGDLSTLGQVQLAGSAGAAGSASGSLGTARAVSGSGSASAGGAGGLSAARAAAGVLHAAASASGQSLGRTCGVAGISAAAASASGDLAVVGAGGEGSIATAPRPVPDVSTSPRDFPTLASATRTARELVGASRAVATLTGGGEG